MGEVRVTARIGKFGGPLKEVEFLADTGGFYTYLSPALCEELGIELIVPRRAVSADNRHFDVQMGIAYIEIDGRDSPLIVGGLDVPMPLLGCEALEGLGFKVNPVDQVLEIARPFPETPIFSVLHTYDP